MPTSLSSRPNSALHKALPHTGWAVSIAAFAVGMWMVPAASGYAPWAVWSTPVAIAGMAVCVGIGWTMAAALIYTRFGRRPIRVGAMTGAHQPVIPVQRVVAHTAVLLAIVQLVRLGMRFEFLTWVWEQEDLLTTILAVGHLSCSGLGMNLMVSLGVVFAIEVARAHCSDRLTHTRQRT